MGPTPGRLIDYVALSVFFWEEFGVWNGFQLFCSFFMIPMDGGAYLIFDFYLLLPLSVLYLLLCLEAHFCLPRLVCLVYIIGS